jgi:hypothetical protein
MGAGAHTAITIPAGATITAVAFADASRATDRWSIFRKRKVWNPFSRRAGAWHGLRKCDEARAGPEIRAGFFNSGRR